TGARGSPLHRAARTPFAAASSQAAHIHRASGVSSVAALRVAHLRAVPTHRQEIASRPTTGGGHLHGVPDRPRHASPSRLISGLTIRNKSTINSVSLSSSSVATSCSQDCINERNAVADRLPAQSGWGSMLLSKVAGVMVVFLMGWSERTRRSIGAGCSGKITTISKERDKRLATPWRSIKTSMVALEPQLGASAHMSRQDGCMCIWTQAYTGLALVKHFLMNLTERRFLPALLLAGLTAASPVLLAQTLAPHQQLARDIFQELVEINTVTTTGDTVQAAEAMAARLRAVGFAGEEVQVFSPRPRH